MSKAICVYLGSEAIDGYTAPCHAFYSPTFDKMWCYYGSIPEGIQIGETHDLNPGFGGNWATQQFESEPGDFIGAKEHPLCKNIDQYRKLYGKDMVYRNVKIASKEVWAF